MKKNLFLLLILLAIQSNIIKPASFWNFFSWWEKQTNEKIEHIKSTLSNLREQEARTWDIIYKNTQQSKWLEKNLKSKIGNYERSLYRQNLENLKPENEHYIAILDIVTRKIENNEKLLKHEQDKDFVEKYIKKLDKEIKASKDPAKTARLEASKKEQETHLTNLKNQQL